METISSCGKTLKAESSIGGIGAAALYGGCSVSMAFINKALMTSFEFDFPVFIMVMQMIFTICLLEILSIFNLIDLPKYSIQRAKAFAIPAFFYGINAVLGLNALSHMNVAMYGVLKRCVPLATMFLSVVVLKKGFPSKITIFSVILITSGCIIASFGDLKFNLMAYSCGILSNLTHSLYLLLVQKCTEKELTVVETLQLNSFNTLPLFSLYMFVNGEIQEVLKYSQPRNLAFIVIFGLTISMGCLLNYSLFLCTSMTSALTTSVVGGIKALLQTVFGMFTFGGISHNMTTYVGITTNLSGSVMYLYAKYREGKTRAQKSGSKMHKVISISTAEDFKEYAKNGYIKSEQKQNGCILHPIREEASIHDLQSVECKDSIKAEE